MVNEVLRPRGLAGLDSYNLAVFRSLADQYRVRPPVSAERPRSNTWSGPPHLIRRIHGDLAALVVLAFLLAVVACSSNPVFRGKLLPSLGGEGWISE